MAYLDPMVINATIMASKPQRTDDYLVEFLYTFQRKKYIFLPYNFEYIFNHTIVLYYVPLTFFYNLWIINYNKISVGFTGSFCH